MPKAYRGKGDTDLMQVSHDPREACIGNHRTDVLAYSPPDLVLHRPQEGRRQLMPFAGCRRTERHQIWTLRGW